MNKTQEISPKTRSVDISSIFLPICRSGENYHKDKGRLYICSFVCIVENFVIVTWGDTIDPKCSVIFSSRTYEPRPQKTEGGGHKFFFPVQSQIYFASSAVTQKFLLEFSEFCTHNLDSSTEFHRLSILRGSNLHIIHCMVYHLYIFSMAK